jgi:hypothetical protein
MYHLHAQNISRAYGHSAVRAACYRHTMKAVDRRTGEEHDFTRKDRALAESFVAAPANAPAWAQDRAELWNRVEAAEDKSTRRKTAMLAKEMNMALPNTIPKQRRVAMVAEFVRENFTEKGLVTQVDFHRGHKADKFKNNHVHVMVTTRALTGDGFGKKDRSIDKKATLYQWRDSWERVVNKELEAAKVPERVTARSFRSLGIDKVATIHVGRGWDAADRLAENQRIREHNKQSARLKRQEAQIQRERENYDTSGVGGRKEAFEREFGQKRKDLERSAARERSEVARALSGAGRVLAEEFARDRGALSKERRGLEKAVSGERGELSREQRTMAKAFAGERRQIFGDAQRAGKEAGSQLRNSQKRAFDDAKSELNFEAAISTANTKTPEGRLENATLYNRQEHGHIKGVAFKELVYQNGKPFEILADGNRDWKIPAETGAASLVPGQKFNLGKSDQQLAEEQAAVLAKQERAAAQQLEQEREAIRRRVRQKAWEGELEVLKREAQPWNRQPMAGRVEAVYRDEHLNHIALARDARGVLWKGGYGKDDPGLRKGDQVTWDASKSRERDRGLDRGDDDSGPSMGR